MCSCMNCTAHESSMSLAACAENKLILRYGLCFFIHTFFFPPPSVNVRSAFQLSSYSNSFTSGLVRMWLLSFSSSSSLYFFSSFSITPPSFFPPSLFFLKNLPLMKLNSLVGNFFGLCVCWSCSVRVRVVAELVGEEIKGSL